jgi:hypothetical protein
VHCLQWRRPVCVTPECMPAVVLGAQFLLLSAQCGPCHTNVPGIHGFSIRTSLCFCSCWVLLQFDPSARLTADDFENTRRAAMSAVRVPQHVIQLLADLRTYLQVSHGS